MSDLRKFEKTNPSIALTASHTIGALLDCAEAIHNQPMLRETLDLMDEIPRLQQTIKDHEDQEKRHLDAMAASLRTYEHSRDGLISAKKSMQDRVLALEKDLARKDKEIAVTRTEAARQVTDIESLQKERDRLKQELKSSEKRNQGLVESIQAEKAAKSQLSDKVNALQSKLDHEISDHENLKNEHERLSSRADQAVRSLKELKGFAITLKNGYDPIHKLTDWWLTVAEAVCSVCFADAKTEYPSGKKNFWTRLDNTSSAVFYIPIPKSNTVAAKQMRSAAILALLARAFSEHLFQPTYLLQEDSGIGQILTHLARTDQAQEAVVRGFLLGLLPAEQEHAAERRIDLACDTVMSVIDDLYPPDVESKLRNTLRRLAQEGCEFWQEIRQLKSSVEPRFEVDPYSTEPENELCFEAGHPVIREQKTGCPKGEPRVSLIVIFPRLCVIEGTSEKRIPAVHLTSSQTRKARDEMAGSSSTQYFGKGKASATSRLIKPSGVSGGPGTAKKGESAPFLGQASAKE